MKQKDTFYFLHDYNARNDDKILELRSIYGVEGYGVFWMIVETMAENSNGGVKASLIGGLSLGYGVAKDRLLAIFKTCIEIGLFYEKEGNYFSKRMLTHKELRNKLSDAGKAGAEKRWGSYSLPNTPPNAKERKGKERKEESNTLQNSSLQKSNLFRQPNIPKMEDVHRVFIQNGGSEEMAKTFYNVNSGLGWFKNGSPITNFSNLVPSYVDNWKKNLNKYKNGSKELSEYEKKVIEDREKAKKFNYDK